jgi:hypothetical protein
MGTEQYSSVRGKSIQRIASLEKYSKWVSLPQIKKYSK